MDSRIFRVAGGQTRMALDCAAIEDAVCGNSLGTVMHCYSKTKSPQNGSAIFTQRREFPHRQPTDDKTLIRTKKLAVSVSRPLFSQVFKN
jgi:hypothetical protein